MPDNPLKIRQDALAAYLRSVATNGQELLHLLEQLAVRIETTSPSDPLILDASDPTKRPDFLFEGALCVLAISALDALVAGTANDRYRELWKMARAQIQQTREDAP